MAVTLEFWKQKALGVIYVSYNREVYKIRDFLGLSDAREIVDLMYRKIEMDYPYEVKSSVMETVGEFIENHFLELDKQFDVVILGNGDRAKNVLFNIEKK